MPRADIVKCVDLVTTARLQQLQGLFDLPREKTAQVNLQVDLPLSERDWSIGLIVGPSGAGKSTILRHFWPDHLTESHEWSETKSVVDGFPSDMGIKEIVMLLCSVGFSSPPAWLKPFHVLSTGEQFRVKMARVLAENRELAVVDEFTSVVDRTVAQIASAAIAKTVRARKQRLIAATCHCDVTDWLQPDWTYEPCLARFQWRSLRRFPPIELVIRRVHHTAWRLFAPHHYLSANLNVAAHCYVAFWRDVPVAFQAVLSQPGMRRKTWRSHRLVCLPDYQGVGIGSHVGDAIAEHYVSLGARYIERSSHPARNAHKARSKNWRLLSGGRNGRKGRTSARGGVIGDPTRLAISFEYVAHSSKVMENMTPALAERFAAQAAGPP